MVAFAFTDIFMSLDSEQLQWIPVMTQSQSEKEVKSKCPQELLESSNHFCVLLLACVISMFQTLTF